MLGSVDNLSPEALRPAVCPRDPAILNNEKTYCTDKDRAGSCGHAAGRKYLNCQQTLVCDSSTSPFPSYGFLSKSFSH